MTMPASAASIAPLSYGKGAASSRPSVGPLAMVGSRVRPSGYNTALSISLRAFQTANGATTDATTAAAAARNRPVASVPGGQRQERQRQPGRLLDGRRQPDDRARGDRPAAVLEHQSEREHGEHRDVVAAPGQVARPGGQGQQHRQGQKPPVSGGAGERQGQQRRHQRDGRDGDAGVGERPGPQQGAWQPEGEDAGQVGDVVPDAGRIVGQRPAVVGDVVGVGPVEQGLGPPLDEDHL